MKKQIIYSLIILAMLFTACKKEKHNMMDKTAKNSLQGHADYEYGFQVFKNLKSHEQQNIVISPISISMTLGVLYNGISDEKKQELFNESVWNAEKQSEINLENKRLMNNLSHIKNGVNISMNNKIYYDQSLSLKEPFIQQSKEIFKADMVPVVPSDVPQNNPQGQLLHQKEMALVNKTSFLGKWKRKFALSGKKEVFTTQTGKGVKVEMMKKNTDIRYLSTATFDMFEIPYQNERIVMTIVMPKEIEYTSQVFKQINYNHWTAYKNQLKVKRNAQVSIPKFHCQYALNVTKAFSNSDLQSLFEQTSSNFPYISNEDIVLNDIIQKSEIRINEEGTDAHVTTFIAKSFTSLVNDNPVNIVVNKPFFFTIEDRETNTFLFLGKIVCP